MFCWARHLCHHRTTPVILTINSFTAVVAWSPASSNNPSLFLCSCSFSILCMFFCAILLTYFLLFCICAYLPVLWALSPEIKDWLMDWLIDWLIDWWFGSCDVGQCRDIKPQHFRSWSWPFWVMWRHRSWFPIGCQSCMVAEILRVKDLVMGYNIFQVWACSDSRGTSFELLTATIGPRALLLRCSDFPLKMHYRGKKLGQNKKGGHQILTP